MTTPQQPKALRLADLLQLHGALPGSVSDESGDELRRLHAENQSLQSGYDAARLEIESLHARLEECQKSGQDWAMRVHALEATASEQRTRFEELDAQLYAVGAGGVEPLRKRSHPPAVNDSLTTEETVNQGMTVQVPPFTSIAQHKLDDLLAQGFRITGYAIERTDVADWAPQRGFVTHGGLVGWWTPHQIDRIPGAQHGQPT